MILTLGVGLLILSGAIILASTFWVAARQKWEEKAEEVRIDREVRRAERQLHNLASRAFSSMLDAARDRTGGNPPTL